jgi:hypothetical protein
VRAGRRHGAAGVGPAVPGGARCLPVASLQPRHRSASVGASTLTVRRSASFVASLWPVRGVSGLRRQGTRRQTEARSDRQHPHKRAGSSTPSEARSVGHGVSAGGLAKAAVGVSGDAEPGIMELGSSRSTRSARTSAAVSPSARAASGSSARVTVRSTTGSARRRPALRRAAWITSR